MRSIGFQNRAICTETRPMSVTPKRVGTRIALWLALLIGIAVLVAVLAYQGAEEIFMSVSMAGWGVLAVVAARLPVLLLDSRGWRALLKKDAERPWRQLAWMWWIGDAANTLLPVAQLGGELLRARLLIKAGVAGAAAGASVVVGLTAGIVTLILFAVGGLVALSVGPSIDGPGHLPSLMIGLGVFGAAIGAFYLAQRRGLFLRLARIAEKLGGRKGWISLAGGAEALDRAVDALYEDRRAFLACLLWRLAGWCAGVGEVWLALYVLGHPVSLMEAFILESLGQAVRSAGFAIPGAIGIQEGGYLLLGALIGVPGDIAVGVSLLKRVREVALGLPGLAAWQISEGRWAFTGRN